MEATTLLLSTGGIPIEIVSLHQTSLAAGNDSDALTLLEYQDGSETNWAAGRHRSALEATVLAVLNAAATRKDRERLGASDTDLLSEAPIVDGP